MTAPATRIRALLVDDEPLARERLRMLLATEDWVEIIGEANNVATATAAIHKLQPDLVFLDVEMPGGSGFDVIEAIGADRMPFVIFVTAYDKYAIRAFDVHAVDYLLKPFDRERFHQGVAKARHQIEQQTGGELERRLLALVKDLKPTPQKLDRFVVKAAGRVFFVRSEEIDWIEAAGNYVKLHAGSEAHLFRETMNALEARLNPDTFYRIHRSHIVNIERVRELQPWFNGEYVVFLKDGTRLTLSRGYREKLQEKIGRSL
jgi:two-component system, LytTR family, response regulator